MGCCSSSDDSDNDSLDDYRPSCPVLFFRKSRDGTNEIYTIECTKLNVSVECYASTAVITMNGEWVHKNNNDINCIFALPTFGTVQSITIKTESQRIITTAILPNDDAQQLFNEKYYKTENNQEKEEQKMENGFSSNHFKEYNGFEEYVAGLFRMPCNNIKTGSIIKISCQYIQTLSHYKKGYILSLPLYFPKGTIVDNVEWHKVITVKCKIYSLSSNIKIDCWTHYITKKEDKENGIITITNGACKQFEDDRRLNEAGRDFQLSYSLKTDKISAYCINTFDTLSLLITPPIRIHTTFGRALFFLLDRSGSMLGTRFREVTRAVNTALDRLRASDMFNIGVFDHRQVYYQQCLVRASKEMVNNAKTWIATYVPERGGTTIDAPIEFALNHLEKSELLPFLVLITDGSVHNEREICERIQSYKGMRTRILTFGIGCLVNNSFLIKLSSLSRGFNDTAFYVEDIYHKLNHLLRITYSPCLSDLEIAFETDDIYLIYGYIGCYQRYNNQIIKANIKQLIVSFYGVDLENEIEMYPFPIPDLYLKSPVVIAARYKSKNYVPKNIVIRGFNPGGNEVMLNVKVKRRNDIAIGNIFLKETIDIMTSNAWLLKSNKLRQKVIDISVNSNIPSIFTKTLVFETNESLLHEEERKIDEYMNSFQSDIVDVNNKYETMKIAANIRNNKKTVSNIAFNPNDIYLIYAYIARFERYNSMITTDIKQLIVSFYPAEPTNMTRIHPKQITGKQELYFWSMSNIGRTDAIFCALGVGLFGFGDVQGTFDAPEIKGS